MGLFKLNDMKILKESESSPLFQIHGLTDEQLIAENDIHRNYRAYLEALVRMSDKELVKMAPGNPEQVRATLDLQIQTCKNYEQAFAEIIKLSREEMN